MTKFSSTHLELYHGPSEPPHTLASGCITSGALFVTIFYKRDAFSAVLEGGLLLVQSGYLRREFCLHVAVEDMAVQDQ